MMVRVLKFNTTTHWTGPNKTERKANATMEMESFEFLSEDIDICWE